MCAPFLSVMKRISTWQVAPTVIYPSRTSYSVDRGRVDGAGQQPPSPASYRLTWHHAIPGLEDAPVSESTAARIL